jgi:hypothetical protein
VKGRVIDYRRPACPGRKSRFMLRHNNARPGKPWWVYYEASSPPVPADSPHEDLVRVVNDLKMQEIQREGGGFSINEHGQVIARMTAPAGHRGNAIHVVGLTGGVVYRYTTPIVFGALDPTSLPNEGDPWPGPLCGMTYTFTAPGHPRPPSRSRDEVVFEVEGVTAQLSTSTGIASYPPLTGPLALFLQALRRQLPVGGRFRVNEHGRAFTSNNPRFIGRVPLAQWFRPLDGRS